MKRKSPTASTGHGTGVHMPVDLHTTMARIKARKAQKRWSRTLANPKRAFHDEVVATQADLDAGKTQKEASETLRDRIADKIETAGLRLRRAFTRRQA